ncbi:hypothetical protein GCM10018790_55750 [Kitasatospora xanthocidica]|uniref:hypothetical protein n=1 Tax=Kitasatospora xanthocidica TaxID=83382 RepID=UPI001678F607|nr:hypothetical protein [Kitasatospora xanthocidica]GHF70795.1 hypothetical protein GCM10018790_55750 [Kitasatospora xanthocidica]
MSKEQLALPGDDDQQADLAGRPADDHEPARSGSGRGSGRDSGPELVLQSVTAVTITVYASTRSVLLTIVTLVVAVLMAAWWIERRR